MLIVTLDAFKASVDAAQPPEGIAPPLAALWWMKKGDWEKAHATAQGDPSKDGAWVHGHLHRVEGDLDNAGYWYGQSGRARSTQPLEEEWDKIASTLLAAVGAPA
jgi:hypothetical protein